MKCPTCTGDFVSGSVFCESCGGTFFYEMTVEENEAYMKAVSEWLNKKRERRVREPTEEARQKEEEWKRKLLSLMVHDSRTSLYGAHAVRNPMPQLRKLTSKLRRQRYAWDLDTTESHQMRINHASIGSTFFLRHAQSYRPMEARGTIQYSWVTRAGYRGGHHTLLL